MSVKMLYVGVLIMLLLSQRKMFGECMTGLKLYYDSSENLGKRVEHKVY